MIFELIAIIMVLLYMYYNITVCAKLFMSNFSLISTYKICWLNYALFILFSQPRRTLLPKAQTLSYHIRSAPTFNLFSIAI